MRRPSTRVRRDSHSFFASGASEWFGDEMPSSGYQPSDTTVWLYGRPRTETLPLPEQKGDEEEAKGNARLKSRRVSDAGDSLPAACADIAAQASADLVRAAVAGKVARVKRAVASRADVNQRSDQGITPLMIAASATAGMETVAVVDELLWCKALLHGVDQMGWAAMHHACRSGCVDVVKHLLKKEADPTQVTSFKGKTPLMLAVEASSSLLAAHLLKHKHVRQHISVKDTDAGSTVLHLAVRDGFADIAKLLLDKNARVNARDTTGQQPLMVACLHNHKTCAHLLVDKLAEIDGVNQDLRTPLMIAVFSGHQEMAVWLLEEGVLRGRKAKVNPIQKDRHNESAFEAAQEMGLHDVIKAVLNHEEFIHLRSEDKD